LVWFCSPMTSILSESFDEQSSCPLESHPVGQSLAILSRL
jgi:hypothetical protein